MSDPFSLVYDGLWDMAERNPELISFFPVGNRIKYEEESDIKKNVSHADLPELSLLAGSSVVGDLNSNTGVSIKKTYIWALASGDLRLSPVFHKVSFELFRAMLDYESTLCPLLWEDCAFVTNCRVMTAEEGTEMNDLNRSIQGWSSLWNVEVEFHFQRSKLRIP